MKLISLIKNELTKLLHKKGIYIYFGILAILMTLSFVEIDNNWLANEYGDSNYYENEIPETLKSLDLTNKRDADYYVDILSARETYFVIKDYDYYSPEYYYVYNDIKPIIYEKNMAKYVSGNNVLYEELKGEEEALTKELDNFNWRERLQKEKIDMQNKLIEDQKEYELTKDKDKKDEIEKDKITIECIEYRLKNNFAPTNTDQSKFIDEYLYAAGRYQAMEKDESRYTNRNDLIDKRDTEKEYYTKKYIIENNLIDNGKDSLQDRLIFTFSYVDTFVIIGFIIIASSLIAEEFNKGTIKQLLVRPFSRTKILTAKVCAGLIACLVFMALYFMFNIVGNIIVAGDIQSLFDPVIVYNFNTGKVMELGTLHYCLVLFVSTLPAYLIIYMGCIFVGVLTTSTAASIVTLFGVMFATEMLDLFFSKKVLSYIPMAVWNFEEFLYGGITYNPYMTLSKSIIVCLVFFVVMVVFTYLVFNKKDIKNQ